VQLILGKTVQNNSIDW